MADHDEDAPEGETPMQRALRLKKAAQANRQGPGGKTRVGDLRAAAHKSSSMSQPWMKK